MATRDRFATTTINLMSLPRNRHVTRSLLCTPGSSVLLVQEADLDVFKDAIEGLEHYTAHDLHKGDDRYDSFVLYDERVWEHVNTVFHLLYEGVHGISKTRHIEATVLRNRKSGREYLFLSWHQVTAGRDKVRRELRAEGITEVRKIIRRHKGRMPIVTGADTNGTANPHPTSTCHVKHGIDHQNAWKGGGVRPKVVSVHVVKAKTEANPSDHGAVQVEYIFE